MGKVKWRMFGPVLAVAPAVLGMAWLIRRPPPIPDFVGWRDPDLQVRIEGYIPLVKMVEERPSYGRYRMSPDAAREVGREWAARFDEGKLKPLRALYQGEATLDDPTGQIFAAERKVTDTLTSEAKNELALNNIDAGIEDIELVLKVLHSLTYSDLQVVTTHRLAARRCVDALANYAGSYSPEQLARAKEVAKEAAPRGTDLADFAAGLRRLSVQEQLRSGKVTLANNVPGKELEELKELPDVSVAEALSKIREQVNELQSHEEMVSLAQILSQALATDIATQKKIDQFLSYQPRR